MRREMAECGRRALSLLEAARSRYESLQISDDVFGESGDDSSDNPFYSTSGDSDSDNYVAEAGEEEQLHHHQKRRDKECGHSGGAGGGSSGAGPPGSLSRSQAEEEGWTEALQDVTLPPYKETYGEAHGEGHSFRGGVGGDWAGGVVQACPHHSEASFISTRVHLAPCGWRG